MNILKMDGQITESMQQESPGGEGGGILKYLDMIGMFCGDDPHFLDFRSNLASIV